MNLINAQKIKEDNICFLQKLVKNLDVTPTLVIVQVEGDEASNRYVKNKINLGKDIGIRIMHCLLPNSITQEALNEILGSFSSQKQVNGIILQLPLPQHLNFDEAVCYIAPEKDVDGLTPVQIGMLAADNKKVLVPCTAKGVMNILQSVYERLEGKDVVIINRSHLIGKPLLQLLLKENCTVTMCHSKTKDLREKVKNADIIITGIGKAHYFDKTWFKDGQTIIDCSMNFLGKRLVGDVDIEDVKELDITISSGKGQTGPMTVLSLIKNTVTAYLHQKNKNSSLLSKN